MTQPIAIADNLRLPATAVTETFGLLAIRGAGKSNAARLMAEQFFDASLPFVAIDPVRAWWGLRASRDGKGPGLPIPIFGGRRGDVPLERTGGTLVADLVARERLSCILDISDFESEAAKKQFLFDFAQRLYKVNEDPLHLFLEEADDYIPQQPEADEKKLMRAWENIVRRGRSRGLGCTLITQRSAVLNKHVLTQVGTLIALRTIGAHDRDAIGRWLKYQGQHEEILASLAELADGEAWVWSPGFLRTTLRIRFHRSRTFDSGATPTPGSKRRVATLADVDLGSLKTQMAATIERAEAEDPKKLRAKIADLERQLKAKPVAAPAPVQKAKAVTVLTRDDRTLLRAVQKHAEAAATTLERGRAVFLFVQDALTKMQGRLDAATPALAPLRALPKPQAQTPRPVVDPAADADATGLVRGAAKMLGVLAMFHPEAVTRARLSLLSGFAPKGGSYRTYLGSLITKGLAARHGKDVVATDAGLAAMNGHQAARPSTSDETLALWKARLCRGEVAMLDCVIAAGRAGIDREPLGDASGFAVGGGSFRTYKGHLKSLGLITESDGRVTAAEELLQ